MKTEKQAHHVHSEDVAQIIFGAMILAVPMAMTEETWTLGSSLNQINLFIIFIVSVGLIALAIFHTGFGRREKVKTHVFDYTLRVAITYMLVFITVATFLTLIERAVWWIEPVIALRRSVLISLPASLSAVAADLIR